MKTSLITLLLLSVLDAAFSQGLNFDIRGRYKLPIIKERLDAAKTMRDINPGYPSSWITDYISSAVLVTSRGKEMKAISSNDILSTEQLNLLKLVDLGTDIRIEIKYNDKNSITHKIENTSMNFTVTLVPEVEATYPGGFKVLKQYLKENAIEKISSEGAKALENATVRFTINERGEIANAEVVLTSKDKNIDKLLLEAINKMPKWKPASNSNGIKVKQQFEFTVGNAGC